MPRVRPTLRCLREDLKLRVPSHDEPLDEIDHPIVAKANEQFADDCAARERIAAIDDQVLFKVKAGRWRGAVWTEASQGWLVAAGLRESGSPDDFYRALEVASQAARRRYNESHKVKLTADTFTEYLLPGDDDRDQLLAESDVRFDRLIEKTVHDLVCASLRDGLEHAAHSDAFVLGIQVRADDGHLTYVAVRIVGSVPPDVVATILDAVPGCDLSGWGPEQAMPARPLMPNEAAYSNIMDPIQAAKLLNADV